MSLNKDNRKFKVFADSGILENKNNNLNLEGHVKMVIESAIVKERFKKKNGDYKLFLFFNYFRSKIVFSK